MDAKTIDDHAEPVDAQSEQAVERPPLTPEAARALAEAQARRDEIDARQKKMPKELGGRGGLDPARYGDWEVKGISSDF